MKKKIETLFPIEKPKDDKKKLIIIAGLVAVILVLAMVVILSGKIGKKETKNNNNSVPQTEVKEDIQYEELSLEGITKTIRLEDGILKVIFENNTSDTIWVDKIEIKKDGNIIYESDELFGIYTDTPTQIIVENENDSNKITVYLYKEIKDDDSGSVITTPEDEKTEPNYDYICTGKQKSQNNYKSTVYYEFTMKDNELTGRESYELLEFYDVNSYNSFDEKTYISNGNNLTAERNDNNKSIKISYNFHFEKTDETKTEDLYLKYVEEQGFKCKYQR